MHVLHQWDYQIDEVETAVISLVAFVDHHILTDCILGCNYGMYVYVYVDAKGYDKCMLICVCV